jgi:hypothetical protein
MYNLPESKLRFCEGLVYFFFILKKYKQAYEIDMLSVFLCVSVNSPPD